MATSTPWGPAQHKEPVCRGINFYSTAGHGGYKVSAKLNERIPAIFRAEDGWYEEDCAYAIVDFFLYDLYPVEQQFVKRYPSGEPVLRRQAAYETLLRWYAKEWEAYVKLGEHGTLQDLQEVQNV